MAAANRASDRREKSSTTAGADPTGSPVVPSSDPLAGGRSPGGHGDGWGGVAGGGGCGGGCGGVAGGGAGAKTKLDMSVLYMYM